MILFYTQFMDLLTNKVCIVFFSDFEKRRRYNYDMHKNKKDRYTIFKTGRLVPVEE